MPEVDEAGDWGAVDYVADDLDAIWLGGVGARDQGARKTYGAFNRPITPEARIRPRHLRVWDERGWESDLQIVGDCDRHAVDGNGASRSRVRGISACHAGSCNC